MAIKSHSKLPVVTEENESTEITISEVLKTPLLDSIFKLLAACAIPLFLWLLSVYKQQAIFIMQIEAMQNQDKSIAEDLKSLTKQTQSMELSVSRLEVKVDAVYERISEVKFRLSNRDNNNPHLDK